jgi:hypothetical protein
MFTGGCNLQPLESREWLRSGFRPALLNSLGTRINPFLTILMAQLISGAPKRLESGNWG